MNAIKTTLAENFTGSHKVVAPEFQFSLDQVPSLSNKVAIVTGGSEGIGYGCTHTLLSHDISKLFILSQSQDIISDAIGAIKSELGEEVAGKVNWLKCDLSDWQQAAEIAKEITKKTDRIDILINNAARGIMTAQKNKYEVDLHMALNHIGHVVLTSHLLPLIKKTADNGNTVRIVNLASNAHQATPKDTKFASLDELNIDNGPNGQYGRSKLAGILYAKYLNRHLTSSHSNILANATHPGFVDTRQSNEHIHEAYPLGGYMMSVGMKPFKKNIFEGCVSTMFAATKTDQSGQYICPPAIPEQGSELANDINLSEQLMKLTRDLVKEQLSKESVESGCPLKDY